jgi:hypothetical protein
LVLCNALDRLIVVLVVSFLSLDLVFVLQLTWL